MGKILKIYFNKIIFVEVFGCCVTSQAHQNGWLGIQYVIQCYCVFLGRGNSQVTALPFLYLKIVYIS
jgi:hypothetical protein